jgi:hypothetical protein
MMAKRESKPARQRTAVLEKRVVALAARMGRIAGTMRAAIDSLRTIRDGKHGVGRANGADGRPRSGGHVDAPGKKHRKAPARRRGVKHSEQAIAKVTSRRQTRPPRRG